MKALTSWLREMGEGIGFVLSCMLAFLVVLGVIGALFCGVLWLVVPVSSAQTAPGTVLRNPSFSTTCGASPCTGSAPTLSTDGRTLVNGSGVKVRLCADSGETLSGAGTMDVYAYDEDDGLWALVPSLALTIPAAASGARCVYVLEDRATTVPTGRVAIVPNAATLSGGNLSVKIYVTVKKAP